MTALFAFLFAILLLVAIHEWGHYIVGRLFDVKVKDFSIGFGSAFYQRRFGKDQTTFSLRWIPLGGFVRFLDTREGKVAVEELQRAFDQKPVFQRFLIVLAGPMINLVLALLLFWLIFTQSVMEPKPLMGQAEAGSLAAQMQIQEGSKLESLGGSSLVSWNAFILALTKATIAQQTPLLTWVTPEGELKSKVLDLSKSELSEEAFISNYQGFRLYQPNLPAKLGLVQENSPAALAGLQVGDVVNAINGQAIDSWQSLVQAIAPLAQQRVRVDFLREGQALSLPVYLGQRPDSQTPVGYLGATVDFAQAKAAYWVERQYGFFEALSMAWHRLEDVTHLTLKALGRMLTGSLSLSNLSGPVSIASHAGESAQLGWMTFVGFLAFLSVSLGILNLLPIPMLDGGHLVYFTWEALTGRPVSEEWQYNAQKLGFALLMGLTGLALYNDLMRIQS